jgi:two-component system sensor histidine kinase/response regulator
MTNTNNHPKILIVDDDPISGMILEGYLQSDNYCVYHVDNGEKALKLVRDIKPDLVIIDVMMPGISGFEVCKTLKNDTGAQGVPVLFTTVLSDPDSHKKGIESGGEGFIVKPFNEVLIRAYIKTFLKTKKTFDNSREKLALNKDFASMSINDLNTLNMVISGYLEMAVMAFDKSTSAKNYVEKALFVHRSASELLKKAQDIRCFESTENNTDFTFINLVDLTKKALSLFETKMESKNLRLELQESDPIEVYGESHSLLRVLVNLINNAVKFSRPDTKIDIAVIKKKEEAGNPAYWVEVVVSNQCSPAPEEYHESIFEKFKQVSGEQKRNKSKGLGLTFCRLVVESHGGRIWVESPLPVEENGVAIHFTLPGY